MTDEKINLNAEADAAIRRAKADVDVAVAFLMDDCDNDAEKMRAFALKGVREAVLLRVRTQRDYTLETHPAILTAADIAAAGAYTIKRVMDYTLSKSGGKRLGDAVKAEVMAEASMHLGFAHGNSRKARWFEQIAARLKTDEQAVEKVLDEEQLKALWEESKA